MCLKGNYSSKTTIKEKETYFEEEMRLNVSFAVNLEFGREINIFLLGYLDLDFNGFSKHFLIIYKDTKIYHLGHFKTEEEKNFCRSLIFSHFFYQ